MYGMDIQIRCRLIQHQDLRFQHIYGCAGYFLFFAAGEFQKALSEQFFYLKQPDGLRKPIQDLFFWHSDIFAAKDDLCVR